MTEQTLIDRYVFEVGKHLPKADRDDVQLELRSALHDMLEERGLDAADEKDTEGVVAMLKEFGHPREVAASYRPTRYLIGPKLFPIYTLVIKIVWGVLTGLYVVGLLVGGIQGSGLLQQIAGFFENYIQALFYSLGIITVIFFFLESTGVLDEEIAEEKSDWDPRELPEFQDPDRAHRGQLITEIVFTAVALVIFNAFLDQLRIPISINGQPGFLTLFAEDLKRFVPMLSIVWAAEIGIRSYVLTKGHWDRWTRGGEILVNSATIYVLYRVVTEAQIFEMAILDMLVKWSLSIAVVVLAVTLISSIYRFLFPGRKPPWSNMRLGSQNS